MINLNKRIFISISEKTRIKIYWRYAIFGCNQSPRNIQTKTHQNFYCQKWRTKKRCPKRTKSLNYKKQEKKTRPLIILMNALSAMASTYVRRAATPKLFWFPYDSVLFINRHPKSFKNATHLELRRKAATKTSFDVGILSRYKGTYKVLKNVTLLKQVRVTNLIYYAWTEMTRNFVIVSSFWEST